MIYCVIYVVYVPIVLNGYGTPSPAVEAPVVEPATVTKVRTTTLYTTYTITTTTTTQWERIDTVYTTTTTYHTDASSPLFDGLMTACVVVLLSIILGTAIAGFGCMVLDVRDVLCKKLAAYLRYRLVEKPFATQYGTHIALGMFHATQKRWRWALSHALIAVGHPYGHILQHKLGRGL
jgi:hypothetical protein